MSIDTCYNHMNELTLFTGQMTGEGHQSKIRNLPELDNLEY